MRTLSGAIVALGLVGTLLAPIHDAQAATARYTTKIVRTLQDDTPNRYAGCMALLQVDPGQASGVSCKTGWVTLDCSGELSTSRSHSSALFTSVQAAMILNQTVWVTLNDTKKASGFCLLEILEAYPPPA